MSNNLRHRAMGWARQGASHLPTPVRQRLARMAGRSAGVQDRRILGRALRVEGHNHSDVDYDDAWLLGLISETDGFVDVGCNVGFFSLATCVLRPSASVLAIDANPECAAVTAANLVRNGFGARSRSVSIFVSDGERAVEFSAVGLGAAGSGVKGLSMTAEDLGSSSTVNSTTLDSVIESTGFRPDLIKVDVEGAEREVLAGANRTVTEHHPRFMVEMHSGGDLTMAANTADVLAWCDAQDYAAWYLAQGTRLTNPSDVAHRGRCHLLLQPAGEPLPAVIEGIPQGAALKMVLDRIGWSPAG